jgi:hypothetical protein
MTSHINQLSPKAQELVNLTKIEGREFSSVSDAIAAHPELAEALDEYIKWREDSSSAVAKSDTSKGTSHPMTEAVRKAGGEK